MILITAIEGVAITKRPTDAVGLVIQTEPLPATSYLALDNHLAPGPKQVRLVASIQIGNNAEGVLI